jgi:hypothetical protein
VVAYASKHRKKQAKWRAYGQLPEPAQEHVQRHIKTRLVMSEETLSSTNVFSFLSQPSSESQSTHS